MKCVLKYLKENSQLDSLLPPTEGKPVGGINLVHT